MLLTRGVSVCVTVPASYSFVPLFSKTPLTMPHLFASMPLTLELLFPHKSQNSIVVK